MITEDYVSFEIAKLLKEKGFDSEDIGEFGGFYSERCYEHGHGVKTQSGQEVGIVYDDLTNSELDYDEYLRPTLQMVMKWLREVHNIETSISYGFPFIDGKRVFKYYWCPVKVTEKGLEYPMDDPDTVEFIEGMADSYEQAIEETIKYSLENLI